MRGLDPTGEAIGEVDSMPSVYKLYTVSQPND